MRIKILYVPVRSCADVDNDRHHHASAGDRRRGKAPAALEEPYTRGGGGERCRAAAYACMYAWYDGLRAAARVNRVHAPAILLPRPSCMVNYPSI